MSQLPHSMFLTVRRAMGSFLLSALPVLIAALSLLNGAAALAHGYSSSVFANATSDQVDTVSVSLQLEYDLLVVSVADTQNDDPLYRTGMPAFEHDDDRPAQVAAIEAHADSVLAYVADRFTVSTAEGTACVPAWDGAVASTTQNDAPYVVIPLRYSCADPTSAHTVESRLFGDDEGYVRDTKTFLTFDLDHQTGSAALDAQQPSVSTQQSLPERLWKFFLLGGEHLLTGLDHILFLLALIVGSRRLREIVLAATAFTLAHSVTFILAATQILVLPDRVVEPIIALSISFVAAWYLWMLWRRGPAVAELPRTSGVLGLDRAGWVRLGAVFAFGLIHGVGFAGALGIDEPWSWTLLWSLLVFNLGIEFVQLLIIAALFPLLAVLHHRNPRAAAWVTGIVAGAVAVVGLFWFVERVVGA